MIKKFIRENISVIPHIVFIIIVFVFMFGFECSRNWTDSVLSVKSDFMISRKVTLKTKGQYRMLGFVLEEPGTYQVPEYRAWEGSHDEPYRVSVFIPSTIKNRKKAEAIADKKASQQLVSEKEKSKYVLDIEKLNKDKEWVPYNTVIASGDKPVVIE